MIYAADQWETGPFLIFISLITMYIEKNRFSMIKETD